MLRRLSACLAAALAIGGCASGDDPGGDAREGGSITVGASALPETLDPALATDPRALQALWLVYTPAVAYKHAEGREGTDLVPGLARDLPEVSEDGLTYTFRLRGGLRYSNGKLVKASDFDRAVRRLRNMNSPLAPLYAGIRAIEGDQRSGRVSVTLDRPDQAFPQVLALPSSAPLPAGTPSEDMTRNPPPGIGQYTIAGVRPGERVVLVRHRAFDLPGIPTGRADRITITRFGSPARQTRALVADTLDVMQEQPPAALLPEIRATYKDRYSEKPTASMLALVPDADSLPFSDESVRRAVSLALDPGELERLYGGRLEPSCNFLPEAVQGYRRLEPCPYGETDERADLIGARDQVEKAGAQGMIVGVLADPAAAPPAVTAYVIRTLRKIGLEAQRVRGPGEELRIGRVAPQLAADPAEFLARFVNTPDAVVRAEISAALAEPSLDDASDGWAAVDELVVEEAYAAPLGEERLPTFLAERIDAENCARFHPLFGIDLSSLCLR